MEKVEITDADISIQQSFVMFMLVVTFWITRWLVVQFTFHLTTWLAMCSSLTSALSLILLLRLLGMSWY